MTSDSGSGFSLERFAVALLAVAVGTATGALFLPAFGGYAGLLAGGFAAGLAFDERPFLEAGAAGVLAGAIATAVENMWAFVLGPNAGAELLLLGAVLGFGLGGLGAHFGNDFRDGLTRPVDA